MLRPRLAGEGASSAWAAGMVTVASRQNVAATRLGRAMPDVPAKQFGMACGVPQEVVNSNANLIEIDSHLHQYFCQCRKTVSQMNRHVMQRYSRKFADLRRISANCRRRRPDAV